MAAENSLGPKSLTNEIRYDRKDELAKGFFKDVGQAFKEMRRGLNDVRSASFHPNDLVLACGLFHGGVVFLRGSSHTTSFENWDIEPKHYPYERTILFIQWNVDGTKVAAGSDDGTVIVFCYPVDGRKVFRRNGRSNFPIIVWNPFNRNMLASYNNAVDTTQVLIVNSATEKPFTMKSKTYCETVAWISHNQLASGYHDGTVEIHEIGSHNRQMKSQVFQKIRHDLGDDGRDRTIFSPFEFPTLHGQTQSAVLSIAFTRNEELDIFASGGSDRRVKIWSLGSNDPVRALELDSNCTFLVWSSDINDEATRKTFIACGSARGSLVIWYPFEHENQTQNLSGHAAQIHQLLFSPDGRYLASTDYFKKLIIWCTKSWKSIYILAPSEFMYPYMMTWDAASCKLAISERTGKKQFKVIEYVVAENCCAGCKKTFQNLKLCARCNSILYCSKECQRSHWPQHKLVCNKNEKF